jgi:hypothetical protein
MDEIRRTIYSLPRYVPAECLLPGVLSPEVSDAAGQV